MKKIADILTSILAIISISVHFLPFKSEYNLTNNVVIFLKNSLTEMILLVIGFQLYKYKNNIVPHIIDSINYFQSFTNFKKWIHGLFIVVVSFFFLSNVFFIARARIYHYNHYNSAHKYDYYKEFCQIINSGEYELAVSKGNNITKEFPDEVNSLKEILYVLQQRIELANIYSSNSKDIGKENVKSISNYEYQNLIASFVVLPNNRNKIKLYKYFNAFMQTLKNSSNYYDLITANDFKNALKIEPSVSWFIFEDFFLDNINRRNTTEQERSLALKKYITNRTKKDFLNDLIKRWYLKEVEALLKWQPNVKLGAHPIPKFNDEDGDINSDENIDENSDEEQVEQ